jgi:hypothetical protein
MLCADSAITGHTSFHKCASCSNQWSSQYLHSENDAGDLRCFISVTQRGLVVEDGPRGCPETSVNNYQQTLCNIPEERSLKSREMISHTVTVLVTQWLVRSRDTMLSDPGTQGVSECYICS